MMKNKKGTLLIAVYLIIAIMLVLLGAFLSRNIWNAKNAARYKQNIIAMHCAEAAIDQAVSGLPASTTAQNNVFLTDINGNTRGEYSYTITVIDIGKKWQVESWGYVPNQVQAVGTVNLEAFVAKKDLPDSFWDNSIYTAGNVRVNGVAYSIEGDIRYAGTMVPGALDPTKFIGATTYDTEIAPLAKFDYESLRATALTQIKADGSDNVYTAAEIFAKNPPFPTNFWYDSSDPNPANWIPNVVYVEDDLVLNGNVGNVGGFFVVVGDVISDPTATTSTTINGNGEIDGCVYSTGEFRINGGGSGLNVLGGVWSGSDGVRLNGSVEIEYKKEYMDAIRYNISPSSVIQVISWRKL